MGRTREAGDCVADAGVKLLPPPDHGRYGVVVDLGPLGLWAKFRSWGEMPSACDCYAGWKQLVEHFMGPRPAPAPSPASLNLELF